MPPTRLFIFGNPMLGRRSCCFLPPQLSTCHSKCWLERRGRTVWLSYDRPEYWGLRHGIPDILLDKLRGIASLCEEVAG